MSLTTDLPPQKLEYESTSGIDWNMDGISSAKVDPIPDNTISIDFANGYSKSKSDMMKKIDAAITKIINKAMESTTYVACGLYEATDIIKKHIGDE